MRAPIRLAFLSLTLLGCGPTASSIREANPAPQPGTPRGDAMAAAADPRAVDAALAMLARGGSATDAAIAASLVLGLVEPQSSGIGGGGFLVHYDGAERALNTYDGREVASSGANATMFLGADGRPMPFREAVASGNSVGVPGLIPMLEVAHRAHGRLPWAVLFEPAISLAEQGFEVSERMARMVALGNRDGLLAQRPEVRAYLFDEAGAPWPVGHVIVNQAYADTLRVLQREGANGLLHGAIAEDIVSVVHDGERPGTLSLEDLAAYQPRTLPPVCGSFRAHRVCSMGGTHSGAIPMLQILGLYEAMRPTPVGADDIDDWSAYLWSTRLAFADRNHYLGDEAFVAVPEGLTDPRYLATRAANVALAVAPLGELPPGDPSITLGGPSLRDQWGWDHTLEVPGTSHLSILDHDGNAVVMTQTVESVFGAMRMTHGFFLNNQLTDFSFDPMRAGGPVANAVAPGKRPRSSMAPTLIFDADGNLEVAIGSPGGTAIIGYVALTIIGHFDWGMPLDEAVELPHLTASGPVTRGELDRLGEARTAALRARGWTLEPTTMEASGLYGFAVEGGTLAPADDSRRPGVARRATPP